MFNEICYKRNFLKNVIVRIDFTSPVEELRNAISSTVEKKVLSLYPIKEPQTINSQQININNNQAKVCEMAPLQLFRYHSKNRSTICNIEMGHIDLNFLEYDRFEELLAETMSIFNSFMSEYKDAIIGRFGLRYINEINIPNEKDKTSWSEYINEKLLGTFSFSPEGYDLVRSFHSITTSSDDILTQMQFGMHNPDYPAPIKKKLFILDLDSSYTGVTELVDLEKTFLQCHEKTQKLFEKSITEKLRELMNAE